MPLEIHIIASQTKCLGDREHAKEIAAKLASFYPAAAVKSIWDVDRDLSSLFSLLSEQNNMAYLIIAVGTEVLPSLNLIEDLKNKSTVLKEKIITVWSSHQYWPNQWEALIGKTNLLALPASEIATLKKALATHSYPSKDAENKENSEKCQQLLNNADQNTRLISALGVPHDGTPQNLSAKYLAFKDRIPQAAIYEIVVLGGKAPDRLGKEYLFTAERAEALGSEVLRKSQALKSTVIITSGPRTDESAIDAFLKPFKEAKISALPTVLPFNPYGEIPAAKGATFALIQALIEKDIATTSAQASSSSTSGYSRLWLGIDSSTMQTATVALAPRSCHVILVDVDSASGSHLEMADYFYAHNHAHRLIWDAEHKKFQAHYSHPLQALPEPALILAEQIKNYLEHNFKIKAHGNEDSTATAQVSLHQKKSTLKR